VEKNCENCKHAGTSIFEKPCFVCVGFDSENKMCHWELKDEPKHEDTYRSCRTCKDSEVISGITPRWECKRNMGSLCGIYYKYWEPNAETKVEEKTVMKIYTTGQMIDMLLENKKLIATGGIDNDLCVGFSDGSLSWLYK
jgi:hypothetical protein